LQYSTGRARVDIFYQRYFFKDLNMSIKTQFAGAVAGLMAIATATFASATDLPTKKQPPAPTMPAAPVVQPYGDMKVASFDFGKSIAANTIGALVIGGSTYLNTGVNKTNTTTGYSFGVNVPIVGCNKGCGPFYTYSGGDQQSFSATTYSNKRLAAAFAAGGISLVGNTGVDFAAYQFGMDANPFANNFSFKSISDTVLVSAAKFGVNLGALVIGDKMAPGQITTINQGTTWTANDNPVPYYSASSKATPRSFGSELRDAGIATFATAGFSIVLDQGAPVRSGSTYNVGPVYGSLAK
jgi:hypothetical protein